MSIQCKYLMPCGRCEKLGGPCDAPKEEDKTVGDIIGEIKKNESITNTPCPPFDHKWSAISIGTQSTTYECENCHQTITLPNGTWPW